MILSIVLLSISILLAQISIFNLNKKVDKLGKRNNNLIAEDVDKKE